MNVSETKRAIRDCDTVFVIIRVTWDDSVTIQCSKTFAIALFKGMEDSWQTTAIVDGNDVLIG